MLCALDETARAEFPGHVLLVGIDANTHSTIAGGPARNLQQVPHPVGRLSLLHPPFPASMSGIVSANWRGGGVGVGAIFSPPQRLRPAP